MNHERALLLAEALESGQYKQGYGHLETHPEGDDNTPRLCCLGVACRVAQDNGLEIDVKVKDHVVFFDGWDGVLPDAVKYWFGFDDCNGAFVNDHEIDGWCALTDLNDAAKYDFAAIAQIIRENWELL